MGAGGWRVARRRLCARPARLRGGGDPRAVVAHDRARWRDAALNGGLSQSYRVYVRAVNLAPRRTPKVDNDWRAVLAANDRVIAAQAATIRAQAQTIAALLATRAGAAEQERAQDGSGTPEPAPVAQHSVLGAWGRVRRWWERR